MTTKVTHILNAIEAGDGLAASQLLPLVYDELRSLAAAQMANEKPGQTLNATALVHEAYLRLIGDQQFENRRHFFAAAAEAMRRILVDAASAADGRGRGGGAAREPIDLMAIEAPAGDEQLLRVHDALDDLARIDPGAATLVKLRFFGGMTMDEVAAVAREPPSEPPTTYGPTPARGDTPVRCGPNDSRKSLPTSHAFDA